MLCSILSFVEIETVKRPQQLRQPPPPPVSRHNDVLVWDIDSKFIVNVNSISNIEITSDNAKDNIDKVRYM